MIGFGAWCSTKPWGAGLAGRGGEPKQEATFGTRVSSTILASLLGSLKVGLTHAWYPNACCYAVLGLYNTGHRRRISVGMANADVCCGSDRLNFKLWVQTGLC